MWKHSRQMTLGLVFVILAFVDLDSSPISSTRAISTVCHTSGQRNEFCGSTRLQYPFYIKSSACGRDGFRLECYNNSTLRIGLNKILYNVIALDTSGIVLDALHSTCSPNLESFNIQGVENYAISRDNYIQLSNCKNITHCKVPNCNIPYMNSNLAQCKVINSCCISLMLDTVWPPGESNFGRFSDLQCTTFISWALTGGEFYKTSIGLKLEWGIPGNCKKFQCHPNAHCGTATFVPGGVRCTCNNGYTGDGYVEGIGCMKECTKNGMLLDDKDCNEEWDGRNITILAFVLIAVATLVGGFMMYWAVLIRGGRKINSLGWPGQNEKRQLAGFLPNQGERFNTKLFTYKTLYRATKGFADMQKCGHGACGTVYAGCLADGNNVAVKRINYSNSSSQQGVRQLLNEISLLSNIKHPNLVHLLGCCLEADEPILVYEFVPNGTLAERLHCERMDSDHPLDWRSRCTIAANAARALAYLHNLNPPLYHRDIKSSNILLGFDFNCKVGDFGLSRLAPFDGGTHISTVPQGTPGYLDPDYHMTYRLTDRSDVYSFGVVLVEIITAMKPVDLSRDRNEVNLSMLAVAKITAGSLDDIIDPSLNVAHKPHVRAVVQRIAELAFRCLAHDKDSRPTMTEVAQELLAIHNKCDDPEFEAFLQVNDGESPDKLALSLTSVEAVGLSNNTIETENM